MRTPWFRLSGRQSPRRYRDPGPPGGASGNSGRVKANGFEVPCKQIIALISGVSLTRIRILCILRALFADASEA
jgi:hypothetical protein